MSRGRIIQVIDSLGPGGAERLLGAYAPRIAKLGFDVEIVVLQDKHGNFMQGPLEAAGLKVHLVRVDKLRRVDQILRFHGAMKRLKPDLVHAHLEFASLLGSINGKLTGTPVVTTLHTLDEPSLGSRRDLRRWLMYRSMAAFADRVICLTKRTAEVARRTGLARATIEILPNGVEIEVFDGPSRAGRSAVRASLGIPDAAPLAIVVSVLRPQKGLDRLLQAFPRVIEAHPDAHLLIVGDGPMMEPLKTMAQSQGLADHVHLVGYRTDVADLMRASDVFVLPTIFDNQPTVIMEAMVSRLPVISTTSAGIPDMVENGVHGMLVEPDNVAPLARALIEMIGNPAKAKAFGEAGHKRAVEEFSMDRQIERLGELYDRLIDRRRSPA